MKNVHDQLAKAILQAVLGAMLGRGVSRLESNREIRGHVLQADVWIEPELQRTSALGPLGLLGRIIARGPCLLEPFSGVPRVSDIRSCILKQHSLGHAQRRDSRTEDRATAPFPRLWVIASGSPEQVIRGLELRPMPGWPAGCLCGPPLSAMHLVVVRQLPRTPETTLVRLLGRRETFRQAVRDVAEIHGAAPELTQVAEQVMRVLIVFRGEIDQHQLEEDDMNTMRDIDAIYAEWRRKVLAEGHEKGREAGRREGRAAGREAGRQEGREAGRQEGRQEGRQAGRLEGRRMTLLEMIRSLCERVGIALTEDRLAQLAQRDEAWLQALLLEVSATHAWPDTLSEL
ncbi:MAG: hypothetical protein AAGC55_15730 [Myxococcota bacterium]